MNLKLDDNFTISTDSHQFILKYESERMEDEKVVKSSKTHYFGSLDGALKGYLNSELRNSELDTDINGLVKFIGEVEQRIIESVKNIDQWQLLEKRAKAEPKQQKD